MKIASWNVNSIRARLDHVLAWLDAHDPDVLCLQETKVKNEQFPLAAFQERGWHVAMHGQPAYNGVALISKQPLENVQCGLPDFAHDPKETQKRFIAADYNGVRVMNVYAPNGDNPESDKFVYKEHWYKHLRAYFDSAVAADQPVLICGDMNIAPKDIDVHDPKRWLGRCGFHPLEHVWLAELMDWGLVDVHRMKNPEDETYSWWDYRFEGFTKNRGLRIDNILTNAILAEKCTKTWIDTEPRSWERPSDHAPVVAEFDL